MKSISRALFLLVAITLCTVSARADTVTLSSRSTGAISDATVAPVQNGGTWYKALYSAIADYVIGKHLYTPSVADCSSDMTSEIEAYMTAHPDGTTVAAGSCLLLGDAGSGLVSTVDFHLHCEVPGTCEIRNVNDDNAIQYYVPDSLALDGRQSVSAIGTATVNSDDILQYVTVSDTSAYHIGDYAMISQSIAVPNRIGSTKNISSIVWDAANNKCVVTTSASHGYSNSRRIFIKGVAATVGGTKIDYLDGSDGYGRTYNITLGDGAGANTTTKFTLQTLSNSDDGTAGTDVNCDTGTYSAGGTASYQNTWAAEANRITGVDPVQNRIFFSHRFELSPLYVVDTATGNVPQLYHFTGARKFSIDGFKFSAQGDRSDLSIGVSDSVIDVRGVPDAYFNNLRFSGTWDAAIIRRGTPGSRAVNIVAEKLPNRGTNDPSGTPKTITDISVASQAVFTSNSHGFSNGGNGIYLSGMPSGYTAFEGVVCRISDATANTFKCKDTYGNYLNSTGFPTFSGTATAGEVADVTGLGYGVSDNSVCFACETAQLYAQEGRHSFTSDGSALSWKSVPTTNTEIARFGIPTYGSVHDVISYGAYGRSLDTHEEFAGYIFRNWIVWNPERGPEFGSYEGSCGQFRGDDITLDNVLCYGGKQGIRIVANDWFRPKSYRIRNLACEGMYSADGTDTCLMVGKESSSSSDLWETYSYPAVVDIDGMRTVSVSQPMWIGKLATVRLRNGYFSDFDDGFDLGAGASLDITNLETDFRDPKIWPTSWAHKADADSDGFNLVKMRSHATHGGAKARIVGLVNTQGSGSSKLSSVFREADTTATKTYFLSGKTEFDPSSVGASSLLSSGATTLSKRTDVTTTGTSTDKITTIPVYSSTTNLTWTAMPAAETVLNGTSAGIVRADLANYSQCRLVARQGTAGASGAKLIARYNAALYAATTISNWAGDLGVSEISVPIDSAANTFHASGWIDIAAAAKSDVTLAIVGSGGDGSASPVFGGIALQCR